MIGSSYPPVANYTSLINPSSQLSPPKYMPSIVYWQNPVAKQNSSVSSATKVGAVIAGAVAFIGMFIVDVCSRWQDRFNPSPVFEKPVRIKPLHYIVAVTSAGLAGALLGRSIAGLNKHFSNR
ncbi:MAG: hypothetical protein JNK33_06775 [Candidatus Doudnabacteria bacterium]|nr:hypothetical protein [Candidatus Doudnabacteria bacterium]